MSFRAGVHHNDRDQKPLGLLTLDTGVAASKPTQRMSTFLLVYVVLCEEVKRFLVLVILPDVRNVQILGR